MVVCAVVLQGSLDYFIEVFYILRHVLHTHNGVISAVLCFVIPIFTYNVANNIINNNII